MNEVFYCPSANEVEIFQGAFHQQLPVLLKGPTGSGKSRFVEFMAQKLDRPLIQVSCNEDTTAHDLLGRFLLLGGETRWQDGPVSRAVRQGAILYLDEVAEAREDVVVVLHSLSDHRRELYLDKINETLKAPLGFMLVASFNPGYQKRIKRMKPSTRQRFLTLQFEYPNEDLETEIILKETKIDKKQAAKLVKIATQIRNLQDIHLQESVSTRLLVYAAKLIVGGMAPRLACDSAIAQVLSDEPEVVTALQDIISLNL